jgi:HK97 gp10 family phage protein
VAEEVIGLDDLLKQLNDVASLVASKKIIVKALREGAEPIRERAEQLAPDDPTTPGSRIKESMMVSVVEQTGTGAIAKIGPSRKGFVGSFQEFGTMHHSAQPFLRPAFDEKKDEAVKIMSDVLAEGIEKEAMR